MKIGIIQASSQRDKNSLLYECTCEVAGKYGHEVINFGCFPEEEAFSYIEIAVAISMLLSSGAIDFIITGCSSGQGMMLACNSLPGVVCGYIQNPQDAFLFGRINNGNAVSYPLGLNFGWAGEINLRSTLESLFDGPFGTGYPPKDADRKVRDTLILKKMNDLTKRDCVEVLEKLDKDLMEKVLKKRNVIDFVLEHGINKELADFLKGFEAAGGDT